MHTHIHPATKTTIRKPMPQHGTKWSCRRGRCTAALSGGRQGAVGASARASATRAAAAQTASAPRARKAARAPCCPVFRVLRRARTDLAQEVIKPGIRHRARARVRAARRALGRRHARPLPGATQKPRTLEPNREHTRRQCGCASAVMARASQRAALLAGCAARPRCASVRPRAALRARTPGRELPAARACGRMYRAHEDPARAGRARHAAALSAGAGRARGTALGHYASARAQRTASSARPQQACHIAVHCNRPPTYHDMSMRGAARLRRPRTGRRDRADYGARRRRLPPR